MTTTHTLHRFWPAAAIVLIAVVTAGVFVRGGRDDQLQARVGQAFEAQFAFDDDVSVSSSTLRLPYGEVDIDTTAPQSHAPSGLNTDDRLAPDGGSFVGVKVGSDAGKPLPQPATADVDPPPVRVALVVGERSYVLPERFRSATDDPANRFAWVAVDGTPKTVQVSITYDGVTQRVDTATGKRVTGLAAPLYRLASPSSRRAATDCGQPVAVSSGFRVDPDDDIRCQIATLGALPYLPGRGWAAPGKAWFTVLVGVFDDARFLRDGRSYRAVTGGSGPAVTAASSVAPTPEPLRQVTPVNYLESGAAGRLAVFPTSAGVTPKIMVAMTYRDLVEQIENPTRTVASGPSVQVTWSVTP